ncbi:MAG: CAP domain-containing protein [Nannocystaceae bacterium]|nr:hypothetical protein [bacterium]
MSRLRVSHFRAYLYAAVLTFSIGLTLPAEATQPGAGTVLTWINAERRRDGQPSVGAGSDIRQVAARHSASMADAGRAYKLPDLRGVRQQLGLAVLTQFEARAMTLEEAWGAARRSREHRAALLDAYDEVGVGVVYRDGYVYVTWLLGRRAG